MQFNVGLDIDRERVADLLCSALDSAYGSIYYWGDIKQKIEPTIWQFESEPLAEHGHYNQDYPVNPGGALILVTEEEPENELVLNAESIQKGLQLMFRDYPKTFADFLAENDDAYTGDVFVQLCLFGEIVYS